MNFRVEICRKCLIKSNAKSSDYHACDEGKLNFTGDFDFDFFADDEARKKS